MMIDQQQQQCKRQEIQQKQNEQKEQEQKRGELEEQVQEALYSVYFSQYCENCLHEQSIYLVNKCLITHN